MDELKTEGKFLIVLFETPRTDIGCKFVKYDAAVFKNRYITRQSEGRRRVDGENEKLKIKF